MWNNTLDAVLGDDNGVTGMRVKNVQDGSTQDVALQGVLAIGHKPNTELFLETVRNEKRLSHC
ncbi:MAG: hypothetical protein R3E08_03915 [Thiotrichaceae bacterium]